MMRYFEMVFKDNLNQIAENMEIIEGLTINDVGMLLKSSYIFKKKDIFELFIKSKMGSNIPNELIFDIVSDNNLEYIAILQKYNIQFDILNDDGMTPLETVMLDVCQLGKEQNRKQLKIYKENLYETLRILSKYNYARNPKYFDIANECCIFKLTITHKYENELFEELKGINSNITEMNTRIIKCFIKENMVTEIIKFMKIHSKFVNVKNIYDELIKNRNVNLISNIEDFLPTDENKIIFYLKNQMYDKILIYKNTFDFSTLYQYFCETDDYESLVFIIEYIDKKYLSYGNPHRTLLHYICSNCVQSNEHARLINYINIIMHYEPDSINGIDEYGNNLLFISCQNVYLVDVLVNLGCCVTHCNNDKDTYIHYIVRNGTSDVLNKVLLYTQIHDILDNVNKECETPLMLACKLKKIDMIQILIKNNANIGIKDIYENNIFHYISMYRLNLNMKEVDLNEHIFDPKYDVMNIDKYRPIDYLMMSFYKNKNEI